MNPEFELQFQIYLRQTGYGSGQIQLSETVTIGAMSFLELAKVLGQFHDLAESIKAARQQEKRP